MKTQMFRPWATQILGLTFIANFAAISLGLAADRLPPLPVRKPEMRQAEKLQQADDRARAQAEGRSEERVSNVDNDGRTVLQLSADNKIGIIYYYDKCRFKRIRSDNRHNYQLDMRTRMMLRFRPDSDSKKTVTFYPAIAEESVTFYAERRDVRRDRAIYCRRLGERSRKKVIPLARKLQYLDGTLQIEGKASADGQTDNRRCYSWNLEVEYKGKKLYRFEPSRTEVDCPPVEVVLPPRRTIVDYIRDFIARKLQEQREEQKRQTQKQQK